MITYLRFRVQRNFRRYQRMGRKFWRQLTHFMHFGLTGKWRQLVMIRRFVLVWWGIVLISGAGLLWQVRSINGMGLVLRPEAGGSYTEALVGNVKSLNPVLPEGSASADINHLVYSGLTQFDTKGSLQPDLATKWEVSADGKKYTFHLRHNVMWHDDVPFTSQDVVFTLAAIQNPDTRSPLASSWQGVTVTAPDDYTVVFSLPKAYTPFLNATTVGLLPRHMLENTDPSHLRVAEFNQHPIGTGPYKLERFDPIAGEVRLSVNKRYYRGEPHINEINFRLYPDPEKALEAYGHRQVQGVSRVIPSDVKEARSTGTLKLHEVAVPDEVAAFFKMSSPVLQDKAVRQALVQGTDRQTIIDRQLDGMATSLSGPLFNAHLNLRGSPHQASYDLAAANDRLQKAGWKRGVGGVRSKDGRKLRLKLVTQSNTQYGAVAKELQQQWGKLGAQISITEVDATTLQQSHIRPRNYDILLYGINVGADPDVYAFWDSSQVKDPGLNLSDYRSPAADKALETGRTVTDPELRAAKYRAFVQAWVADTPAVMLYSPSYIYATDNQLHGVHIKRLINPSDRFSGVENWSVKVKAVKPD